MQKTLFLSIGIVLALFGFGGMVLMTDVGQLLALPRSWMVAYATHQTAILFAALVGFFVFATVGYRNGFWKTRSLVLAGGGLCIAVFAATALNPMLFPTQLATATYLSVPHADALLDDAATVYVIENQGDAVAFPQRFMEIPHVAGATVGGQSVAMTYSRRYSSTYRRLWYTSAVDTSCWINCCPNQRSSGS